MAFDLGVRLDKPSATGSKGVLVFSLRTEQASPPFRAALGQDACSPIELHMGLSYLKEGQNYSIELPSLGVVPIRVNFSRADDLQPALWMIGGELGENRGSIYFAHNQASKKFAGRIILENGGRAWAIESDAQQSIWLRATAASKLICANYAAPPGSAEAGGALGVPSTSAIFIPSDLQSRPGSPNVLYLDFRGGTYQQPTFNKGVAFEYPAIDVDATFVETVWKKVVEDFRSFNINITTSPAIHALASPGNRMRTLITTRQWGGTIIAGGIGGISGIGDFAKSGDTIPSSIVNWIFYDPPPLEDDRRRMRRIANAISHEFAHTLGLQHWGSSEFDQNGVPNPDFDYYPASSQQHGTGGDSWSPLMGQYSEAELTQWGRGEFYKAGNQELYYSGKDDPVTGDHIFLRRWLNPKQDDIAALSVELGPPIDDDRPPTGVVIGNDPAGAANLRIVANAADDRGVIYSSTDEDWFRFETLTEGYLELNVKVPIDGNLDAHAELRRQSGPNTVSVTSNAITNSRNAQIQVSSLSPGVYFLVVRGNAQGNPLFDGWSRYGSLGSYTIKGTVAGAPNRPDLLGADPAPGTVGVPYSFNLQPQSTPTLYQVTDGSLPPGLSVSAGFISGTPLQTGPFTATITASNSAGGVAKEYDFTIYGDASLPDSLDAQAMTWTTNAFPSTTAPSALWNGQRGYTQDGIDAARSGTSGTNSESWLETLVAGPGRLTFEWRTSSAPGDRLTFRRNNTDIDFREGENSWQTYTHDLPQGSHFLRWYYRTDGGVTAGQNAGFVDRVRFQPSPSFSAYRYLSGTVGKPMALSLSTESGVTFALTSGALPPGLSLNAANGAVTGTPAASGQFVAEFTGTNAAGASSTTRTFFIFPDITLNEGVDAPSISLNSGGNNPWVGTNSPANDGVDAVRAGPVTHNGTSLLQASLSGPGRLSFFVKTSSEVDDLLKVDVDGDLQDYWSTEVGWLARTLIIPQDQPHTVTWLYQKNGGGNAGQDTAWVDQLVFRRGTVDLDEAADNTSHAFNAPGGLKSWYGQQVVSSFGGDAAQSPILNHGESAFFETTVTGPGTITFDWRADCEATNDYLKLEEGVVELGRITSNTGWTPASYPVGSGSRTLRWTFFKNGSVSTGADASWVDHIVFQGSLPVFTSPTSLAGPVGYPLNYDIAATNSPTSYNQTGTLPPGMFFSPTIHLITGFPTQAGVWTVSVSATNGAGTTSQNVTLYIQGSRVGWSLANNLTGTNALALADPDGDGLANLIEMALARNPNVRDNGFQPVDFDAATNRLRARFRFNRRLADVTYYVETSTDAINWTPIFTGSNLSWVTTPGTTLLDTFVSDMTYDLEVRDATAAAGIPRRFMRMRFVEQ